MIKVGDIVDYKGTPGVVMKGVGQSTFYVKMLHEHMGMCPTETCTAGELGERFINKLTEQEKSTAIRFLQQIVRGE